MGISGELKENAGWWAELGLPGLRTKICKHYITSADRA